MTSPSILLLGASGQVGAELQRTLAPIGHITSYDRSTLNLYDLDTLYRVVATMSPDLIVNAAAYTQVDLAESEAELPHRINAEAPAVLARVARECGAVLVHYSSDYVFDGTGISPYCETDITNPISVYGRSKRDGDAAILESGALAYIFRISWVYSRRRTNFLRTVERLVTEGKELRIVADQFGSPTWSRTIANATTTAIDQIFSGSAPTPGVYHMASPDYTSWAEFAQTIINISDYPCRVTHITTPEYPTPACRPRWSVLNSTKLCNVFGIEITPWREQLAACLTNTI